MNTWYNSAFTKHEITEFVCLSALYIFDVFQILYLMLHLKVLLLSWFWQEIERFAFLKHTSIALYIVNIRKARHPRTTLSFPLPEVEWV